MVLTFGGSLRITTEAAPVLTELGVHVPTTTGWR